MLVAREPQATEGVGMNSGLQRWAVIAVTTVGFVVGMMVTAHFDVPAPTQAVAFWGSDESKESEEKTEPPGKAGSLSGLPDFVASKTVYYFDIESNCLLEGSSVILQSIRFEDSATKNKVATDNHSFILIKLESTKHR